jgi:hypothetical protein
MISCKRLTKGFIYTLVCLSIIILNSTKDFSILDRLHSSNAHQVVAFNLFSPMETYLSESLLTPLIANITGMNATPYLFQVLSLGLVLGSLLVLSVLFSMQHKTIGGLIVTSILFSYYPLAGDLFRSLGYPDPLTMILLILATATKTSKLKMVFIFFAGLSHFSMVAVALTSLLLIDMIKSNMALNVSNFIRNAHVYIIPLILSKLFIIIFGYIFEYSSPSRFTTALSYGLDHFIEWNLARPYDFIDVLGIPGVMYVAFVIYKYRQTMIPLFITLTLSYIAFFFTEDRPRVFGVVFAPMYIYIFTLTATYFDSIMLKAYAGMGKFRKCL